MFVQSSPHRRLLGLMLLVLMALLLSSCKDPVGSQAAPIAQSYAWLMDDSGQATLSDIQARSEWQTFNGTENWGFGTAPVWVRYTLRAALPGEAGPWVVRVRPPLLEKLTLFDPVAQLQLSSGINTPQPVNALKTLHFSFEIPALAQERQIYLRIHSHRSRLILTDVVIQREAVDENQSLSWLIVFLITISTVLAVWASAQWVLSQERVIGAFALKQWTATLWALSLLGFLRVSMDEQLSIFYFQWLDPFLRIWVVGVAMGFWLTLLQEYAPHRAMTRACTAVIVVFALLPFLEFAGLTMSMSVLANCFVLVGLTLVILTLLTAPKTDLKPPIPRWLLGAYLLVYAIFNSASSAVFLDLIPLSTLALSGNLSHIFLDGLVVFSLLQMRARKMAFHAQKIARDNQIISLRLDRAQHDMTLEQQRRREQSQFLHMLMHELKTPLSIVSLAIGNQNNREENLAYAGRAVQDMKAIIDRCILADQTGEASLAHHTQQFALDKWMLQLAQTMPQLAQRLKVASPAHLPDIEIDEQLLRIILVNLLSNAAHYSDPLTSITVTLDAVTHNQSLGVSLRVSNTPGLAGWPDPAQVFTKYYRASGAQRESGSGLGLFLSRQLAQQLGGTLAYAPSPSQVAFVLWIPLCSA